MKFKTTTLAFIVALSINGCSKDNQENKKIVGKIINGITKKPVMNVQVSLLENGPTKTTDSLGKFSFTQNESEMTTVDASLAVSLTCNGYLPREVNVKYTDSSIIEITPDSLNKYYYIQPVQLSDGLQTSTLLAENMDTALIQQMMDQLAIKKLKEIHSILIFRNGKLILENYYFGNNDTIQFENDIKRDRTPAPIQWTRKGKHYVASVNKALTSSVVGIALNKFGKSVSDKISTYLPDYASYFTDANKNNVTIENCLTMTLGFKWNE